MLDIQIGWLLNLRFLSMVSIIQPNQSFKPFMLEVGFIFVRSHLQLLLILCLNSLLMERRLLISNVLLEEDGYLSLIPLLIEFLKYKLWKLMSISLLAMHLLILNKLCTCYMDQIVELCGRLEKKESLIFLPPIYSNL